MENGWNCWNCNNVDNTNTIFCSLSDVLLPWKFLFCYRNCDTRKYLCNHFIVVFIVLYKHCFRHYNVYIVLVPPLHRPSPRRERRGHVIHCPPRAAIQSPPLPAPRPAPAPYAVNRLPPRPPLKQFKSPPSRSVPRRAVLGARFQRCCGEPCAVGRGRSPSAATAPAGARRH